MILILLAIGAIIIVAAFRNSQGALFAALYEDVPGFVIWAAAIFAIGAVGFIPGLKPVSRGLLALILVVIVLRNYREVIAGFENMWQAPPPAAPGPAEEKDSFLGGLLKGIPDGMIPDVPEFLKPNFGGTE